MDVLGATVILSEGSDKVIIRTGFPSTMKGVTKQPLSFYFDVEYDKGIEYVKEIFKIEPTIVNNR